MGKFYNIDPETCSKEELEAAIAFCENREEYYHTMEQSCKIYINSMYGAMGSAFYSCANKDIAESITLQGQNLIKFSVKVINDYFNNVWPEDVEAHAKVAEFIKERHPEFDVDKFMEMTAKNVNNVETYQVYGDSVDASSILYYINESNRVSRITISELFNLCIKQFPVEEDNGHMRVRCPYMIMNYDGAMGVKPTAVRYIMGHKVTKDKWRLRVLDKTIDVTCDHSLMVIRNGEMIKAKPSEIKSGDRIPYMDSNHMIKTSLSFSCEKTGQFEDEWVYDVEMDDESHTFIANDILVHNTDSVSADSVIVTEKHKDGIKISDFYNENIENTGDITLAGHESVNTDDKVLNYKSDEMYYGNVKRIIRHKVSKPKWRLESSDGKVVECTDNHSLVVIDRNGEFVHRKPSEVLGGVDCLLCSSDLHKGFVFTDVESCKHIGEYDDEYVYDIEMDDETHTFMCNGILVHNSAYMTIQPLVENYPELSVDYITDFTLGMYSKVLESYLENAFELYAKKFNCPENKQVLELEKIARSTIMLAKKNYIMDIAWVDSGSYIKPLHKVNVKGFDTVKGSTPSFCRSAMKGFITKVLEKLDNNEMPSYAYIVSLVRDIKKQFKMQNPDDICKSSNISDMEKCVLNDRYDGVYDFGVIYRKNPNNPEKNVTTPIHVRAAATYNYALSSVGKEYMSKYNFVHSGDKVKYYYCCEDTKKGTFDDDNAPVFAFFPGEFPVEFAPKMDFDMQFEKTILSPLNRIVCALGYNEIPATLTYSAKLW